MVDIVKKYHKSYKGFFTPEECEYIISVFEKDKDHIPYGSDNGYTGLTATYDKYNWLYNEALEHLNIEQRLFNLPEFKQWEYMLIQCWGNKLEVGDGLAAHTHGVGIQHEWSRRHMFYNTNIFLGGEYNLTWYEDYGIKENEVGDIHVFTCDLDHEVYDNQGNDPRYSMAMDIFPEWDNKLPIEPFRFKTARNEHTQYRDTAQMRFYTARALFAIDFHNQCIMDESMKKGERDDKAIAFHTRQRERLIEWSNEYKDYIHGQEERNREYGFEVNVPELNFDVDRATNKK